MLKVQEKGGIRHYLEYLSKKIFSCEIYNFYKKTNTLQIKKFTAWNFKLQSSLKRSLRGLKESDKYSYE